MQPGTDRPSILLVDDSAQLLQILEELLITSGFEVTSCNSVSQALNLLRISRPDLILCDVMMPEVDGFQLHAEVKDNSEWCDIPFVFLTAVAGSEEVRFGKELGCDDYITKPFDPADLAATIRGKIAVARRRREKQKETTERFRKRVVHTLSHEFRTPLVAINTGTELLLEQHETLDSGRLERLLASIQRGGMRLQRLVEDFMTLQQIDSGSAANLATRFRRVHSMRNVVELALDGYQDYMRGEKFHVVFRPETVDSTLDVVAYDVQLIAVIHRLIANAQKFGGPEKNISVWLSSTPDTVSFHIRDRGPGLPDHLVQQACDLFQQIDRERNEQQGCGVGLTISRYFAELNGGDIFFRSPTDGEGGLEVEFRLPRSQSIDMNQANE